MHPTKPYITLLILFLLVLPLWSASQLPYNLIDGRQNNYCTSCKEVIDSKPPEVLFGINIQDNGDVYFSISNKEWFDKIISSNSFGIAVDLVTEDRYACDKTVSENFSLPKGALLKPVYRAELLNRMQELSANYYMAKIGTVPKQYLNRHLEGNLVVLNGNYICYYTNFLNIDRSLWQLLPMGLYTDTLLKEVETGYNEEGGVRTGFYTTAIQVEIPFAKAGTTFNKNYLNALYDSLNLGKYSISKVEIRAYSSIEGPEKLNKELMTKRAEVIKEALKMEDENVRVITAENWLEFYSDIEATPRYTELLNLSKAAIKQKLMDTAYSNALEPLLSQHRKAIVTMYLNAKAPEAALRENELLPAFQKVIEAKDIPQARALQKEIFERIMDNRLPAEYMDKLTVPYSKQFSPLYNDREVFKYLLQTTSEYEALENLLTLRKLDPGNGHINYNICSLRFFMWQYADDSVARTVLLQEINQLPGMGINNVLYKRMLINYYILKSEDQMRQYDYAGKDASLKQVHAIYYPGLLNDEDRYSLARYYSFYAHQELAYEIIQPRIDKVDVSEDLVFYYVNLLFFNRENYEQDSFKKALLNAINLNPVRFCNFFSPNDTGGAGMQLLDHKIFKNLYCETCR